MIWLLVHLGRWRFARWLLRLFIHGDVLVVDSTGSLPGSYTTIAEALEDCVPCRGDIVLVAPHHKEHA